MPFLTGAVMKFTVFCLFIHGVYNILCIRNSMHMTFSTYKCFVVIERLKEVTILMGKSHDNPL